MTVLFSKYCKTCLKRPLQKRPNIVFEDRFLLNAGQKYCTMFQESILQRFPTSLSYHLSLRPLFCIFSSGRFRPVLLYLFNRHSQLYSLFLGSQYCKKYGPRLGKKPDCCMRTQQSCRPAWASVWSD